MNQELLYLVASKFLKIVGYLIGGQIVIRTISLLSKKIKFATKQLGKRKIIHQQERLQTIRNMIVSSAKIVINFIVFMMILSELGVDIAPLLAGAGVLGLAIGFGAKNLVSDVIAGFFFILENQFNIGDTVQVGSSVGKVIRLTLRTLTLKDEEGKLYIIPNANIKFVIKFPNGKKS